MWSLGHPRGRHAAASNRDVTPKRKSEVAFDAVEDPSQRSNDDLYDRHGALATRGCDSELKQRKEESTCEVVRCDEVDYCVVERREDGGRECDHTKKKTTSSLRKAHQNGDECESE